MRRSRRPRIVVSTTLALIALALVAGSVLYLYADADPASGEDPVFTVHVYIDGTVNTSIAGSGTLTFDPSIGRSQATVSFSQVPVGWNGQWPSRSSLLSFICGNACAASGAAVALHDIMGDNYDVSTDFTARTADSVVVGHLTQTATVRPLGPYESEAHIHLDGWYTGPTLVGGTGYDLCVRQLAPGTIEGHYTQQMLADNDTTITNTATRLYTYSGGGALPANQLARVEIPTLDFDGTTLTLETVATCTPAATVGGIARLSEVANDSGRSTGTYAGLAGGLAAAVVALAAGAWYARRRWLR